MSIKSHLPESYGYSSYCVIVRTALQRWEYSLIYSLLQIEHNIFALLVFAFDTTTEENQSGARAAQRLVCSTCYHIRIIKWAWYYSPGYQSTNVCHISQEMSHYLVTYLCSSQVFYH
jgi:hypothetical protein